MARAPLLIQFQQQGYELIFMVKEYSHLITLGCREKTSQEARSHEIFTLSGAIR